MALVLGEEKKAKPKPIKTKRAMINDKVEFSSRKMKKNSPIVVNAIPIDATIRGSILSESLPAKGEKIACTNGCASNINPAPCGLSPLICCK